MSRHQSDAIIYKLHKYSDNSAVAKAFTADFGKVKLFVPKAFSKRGGLLTCLPGNLDFQMKEHSDLFRFHSFAQKPEYYMFINNHEIVVRLHLLFECIDLLYEDGLKDGYLWKLFLRIDDTNFRKAFLFTLRHIFEKSGILPDFTVCSECGCEPETGTVAEGEFFCEKCRYEGVFANGAVMLFMRSCANSELVKRLSVNREMEADTVRFLSAFYKSLHGKDLKSSSSFFTLI
jgi:DNA repair protein RecO (recombination protein O)